MPEKTIVMLGDSITEGGDWENLLPNATILNHGIGGDTTAGVLRRLRSVVTARPAAVMLLIGTNDIGIGVPEDAIVANSIAIVQRLRTELPAAGIYVQSIMPREPRFGAEIVRVNAAVSARSTLLGAAGIDLWPAFADGAGGLRDEFSLDGLHLSEAGYAAWAVELRRLVPLVR